jgi:hypothetical protein
MGLPGPDSSQYGSQYSMSRIYGPRDIISLVIPRLGDNTKDFTKSRGSFGSLCPLYFISPFPILEFNPLTSSLWSKGFHDSSILYIPSSRDYF